MARMLFGVALLLAGISGAVPARAEQVVDQKDKQFSQDAMTVKVGESVSFTNSDQVTHDLSIKNPDGSRLMSAMQKPGDQQSITFDKLGSYKVQCLIHPKMKMTVTAQ
jgi:plastocyanin